MTYFELLVSLYGQLLVISDNLSSLSLSYFISRITVFFNFTEVSKSFFNHLLLPFELNFLIVMLYQTKHYAVMGIHINYITQYQLNNKETKDA